MFGLIFLLIQIALGIAIIIFVVAPIVAAICGIIKLFIYDLPRKLLTGK